MKKIFASLIMIFFTFGVIAQETTGSRAAWSDEVKIYCLVAMAILTIFFTIRTFRNKPEA